MLLSPNWLFLIFSEKFKAYHVFQKLFLEGPRVTPSQNFYKPSELKVQF